MATRLKVFETRIGVSDWAVAAPSQKAALKAWDVRENLFASGAAKETQDPRAIELALKNPGVPVAYKTIKIPLGETAKVITLPTARAKPKPAPTRPAPDRSKLDAAEAAVRDFRAAAQKRRAALERRRRELEEEVRGEEASATREERQLVARIDRARAAFESDK